MTAVESPAPYSIPLKEWRETVEQLEPKPTSSSRFTPGGPFVLDVPAGVPSIWGHAPQVAWAQGEAIQIVGPPGVGKSTLAGQLVRGRLGLSEQVLGWKVTPGSRRLLYLAMDRPAQIQRALHRHFTEAHRGILNDRLVVWKGPPPADFAKHPEVLTAMCVEADADTVVIDSLKDAAIGLSEDEVGAAYNRARQLALVNGIEVVELHHQVKRGNNGGKPNTLADVYGSAWLTAGAGSVVLLWGAAGDPIIELAHLKPPAEAVGPLRIIHDHTTGESTIWHAVDILSLAVVNRGNLTARLTAMAMNETDKPDRNQIEKARRQLDRAVRDGHLIRRDGTSGGADGGTETTYGRAS
jgi:GTPase SAR1 family protein